MNSSSAVQAGNAGLTVVPGGPDMLLVPEAATGVATGVQRAVDRFYDALNHVLNGDPQPMLALWSRDAEVSLLDPRGALLRGWDAVSAHWEWLARVASCGRVMVSDLQVSGAGALVYVTATEHVRAAIHRQSVRVAVRSTTLYGPAPTGASWVVVHRHSDPVPLLEHALRGQGIPPRRQVPWKD